MGLPEVSGPGRARPLLVTGVPRSGTTWLARQLADRPGAGMPGREPMNPRGGQFALGGTLTGWAEVEEFSRRQQRLLRRCAGGREPRTFGRYGVRQLRGALPWTTTVIKDPFALLSVPAVVQATGARAVVVVRHPGAVLASYRRMGWRADVEEVRALVGVASAPSSRAPSSSDAAEMAEFWTALHSRVLLWLPRVPDALLVLHAELTLGGTAAVETLAAACGLPARRDHAAQEEVPGSGRRAGLHDFHRRAEDVVDGWRRHVDPADRRLVEDRTRAVWEQLMERRTVLPGGDV